MKTKTNNIISFVGADDSQRDAHVQAIVQRAIGEFNEATNNAFADCIVIERQGFRNTLEERKEELNREDIRCFRRDVMGNFTADTTYLGTKGDHKGYDESYVDGMSEDFYAQRGVYDGYRIAVRLDLSKHAKHEELMKKQFAAWSKAKCLSHDGRGLVLDKLQDWHEKDAKLEDYARGAIFRQAKSISSELFLGDLATRVRYSEYTDFVSDVLFYLNVVEYRWFQFRKTDRVFAKDEQVYHSDNRIYVRHAISDKKQNYIEFICFGMKCGVSKTRGNARLGLSANDFSYQGDSSFDLKRMSKLVKERFESRCNRISDNIEHALKNDYDALTSAAIENVAKAKDRHAMRKAKSDSLDEFVQSSHAEFGVAYSRHYNGLNVTFTVTDLDVARDVAEYIQAKHGIRNCGVHYR